MILCDQDYWFSKCVFEMDGADEACLICFFFFCENVLFVILIVRLRKSCTPILFHVPNDTGENDNLVDKLVLGFFYLI